jgi:8-oxo-dGTP pyrophosphatase MutT (NUDIX family)
METAGGSERLAAPRWLAEHAQRFRESGVPPAVPRLAATVILLRDQPAGLEVYAQRRAATMAFAPGMYAFPGGSVSPEDADPSTEPDVDPGIAMRMGLLAESARGVLRAAVRELAEETGVRLATGQLAPWSRWLTPEFEPRRYDTFFFLAALPGGQHPADPYGEADHALWVAPAEALHLPMLLPTRHTLAELARFPDVASAIEAAAGRDISEPVRPVVEFDADGAWLRVPRST